MTLRRRAAAFVIVVLVVAFVVVVVWGIRTVSDRSDSNCDRIHQVVRTLDEILGSGEAQTAQYVREGLLTAEQGARADRYRERQRAVLRGADCLTP